MLQYAWYSVISPEGCAAILWKQATPQNNAEAAEALKAHRVRINLQSFGTINDIIEEPLGSAYRRPGIDGGQARAVPRTVYARRRTSSGSRRRT